MPIDLGKVKKSIVNNLDRSRYEVTLSEADYNTIIAELRTLRQRLMLADELAAQKDSAYQERDKCVSLIARMALALGWRAGLGKHQPPDDPNWEQEWLNIVFIDLPNGQVSWHIHDSELSWFAGLPNYDIPWDGHSTEEKYRRVLTRYRSGGPSVYALAQKACEARQELCDAEKALADFEKAMYPGDASFRTLENLRFAVHGASERDNDAHAAWRAAMKESTDADAS